MCQRLTKGFNLIELMITLLVMSILTAMGLPRIASIVQQVNAESAQQNLLSNLYYARTESVKNGSRTILCPSNNGTSCLLDLTDWSQGWILYTDNNQNSVLDTGTDPVIRFNQIDSPMAITWPNNSPIVFEGDGTVTDTSTGVFRICEPGGATTTPRGVTVNLSGRVRTTETVSCP